MSGTTAWIYLIYCEFHDSLIGFVHQNRALPLSSSLCNFLIYMLDLMNVNESRLFFESHTDILAIREITTLELEALRKSLIVAITNRAT